MIKRTIQAIFLSALLVVLWIVLPAPVRLALQYAAVKAWERLEWLALQHF